MANKKLKYLLKFGLPVLMVVSLLVGLGVVPALAEAGPLDRVTISPASATLVVGATQQFTAQGYDANNNPISGLTYIWNVAAGGGSISITGLFTAGSTLGSFPNTIQAFAVQGSVIKFGTASLMVTTAPPGPLDHVTVSPASATLVVGATQQFTAQGYDAANNVIPGLTYIWNVAAGGGSISITGLFTAGNTLGSFPNTIQAFAVQGSVIKFGTASVTVSASTPTPTPTPKAKPGVKKLLALVTSSVRAIGFNNLLSAQWSVKAGDKTMEVKAIAGVLQAISDTSLTILPTGQTNSVTFTLTRDTIIRGEKGLKIGKRVGVVTVDGVTSLVAQLPMAESEKGLPPGLRKGQEKWNEGKTPPFGVAKGHGKQKNKDD